MLMNKLQIRFGVEELRAYFTVNAFCEKDDWINYAGDLNEYTERMKCMPCAFPRAIQTVDKIYKTFNQMFFGANK